MILKVEVDGSGSKREVGGKRERYFDGDKKNERSGYPLARAARVECCEGACLISRRGPWGAARLMNL